MIVKIQEIKMKILKIFPALLLLLTCSLFITSCRNTRPVETSGVEVVYLTVTFDSNGGNPIPSAKARMGGYASEPSAPVRDGYIFDGWVRNGREWLFETDKVEEDITLSAKWIDAKSVYAYEPVGDTQIKITEVLMELEEMTVPAKINGMTVVAIADGVFCDMSSSTVKKIVLPETVTSIGKSAFENCEGIKFDIKGELTSLGDASFKNCTSLVSVPLGEGLTSVPFQAFSGCTTLTSVTLPKSVTTVCENAFEECETMTYVMLKGVPTSIEDAAFRNCTQFKYLYVHASSQDIDGISVATNNDAFKSAKRYVYSESKPQAAGDFWYIDEKGRIKIWK